MNMRAFWLASLIAGVVMGLLGGLPLISVLNCVLCLWVWLSAILALVSFIHFLTQLKADSHRVPLWEKHAWVRPFQAAGVMFLYTLAMDWIGFFSGTFLLFLVWLILIEKEKWLTVGLVSVLGTISFFLVFTVFLKVPLPRGIMF